MDILMRIQTSDRFFFVLEAKRVSSDFCERRSSIRINRQHYSQQVLHLWGKELRLIVLSLPNLLVENFIVVMLKRQVSANHSVKHDSTAPQIS